jgi:methionyl-tRNA formyltransferase
MGTPEFAVPVLEALADNHQVVGVVTQPDRVRGRGRKLAVSPVKELALEKGFEVFQPSTLRQPEVAEWLEERSPEVIVVAAFGQILPPAVLSLPPKGCINVHASLLPRHRGASPIANAILLGDDRTGVTIMVMDEGMDTGPMLDHRALSISPEDTTLSLGEKLAPLGAGALMDVLPEWMEGRLTPKEQDESATSYSRPLTKADGRMDWRLSAVELWRRVRAYHPWPGTHTYWEGKLLRISGAGLAVEAGVEGDAVPGRVYDSPEGLAVATGDGGLVLKEVQLAGKRAMPAEEFLRGQRKILGSVLG